MGPTRPRFLPTRPLRDLPRCSRPVNLRHVTSRHGRPDPTRPLPRSRSRSPRQPPSRAVAQPVAGALGSLGPRRGRRASERAREGRRKGGLASEVRLLLPGPAKAASPSPTDSHAPSEGVTERKTLHRTLSHQGLINTVLIREKRRSVPIFFLFLCLFFPPLLFALRWDRPVNPDRPTHQCRCDVVGSIESEALGALGFGFGCGIGLVFGVKLS